MNGILVAVEIQTVGWHSLCYLCYNIFQIIDMDKPTNPLSRFKIVPALPEPLPDLSDQNRIADGLKKIG